MKMWLFGFFILLFSISSFAQTSYTKFIGVESLESALKSRNADAAVLELHDDIVKLETDTETKKNLKRKVEFLERKAIEVKLEMKFRVKQLQKNGSLNELELADYKSLSNQALLIDAYIAYLIKPLDMGKVDASVAESLNRSAVDRTEIAVSNMVITGYLTEIVIGQLKADSKHTLESINRLDSIKYAPDSTSLRINLEVKEN
ncbi:MAG: hypothetical protein JNM93_09530 [Bacteriovoracaceae bacterium]|nr:hypothetical protein [Bacteriovoracaceae bacterium]